MVETKNSRMFELLNPPQAELILKPFRRRLKKAGIKSVSEPTIEIIKNNRDRITPSFVAVFSFSQKHQKMVGIARPGWRSGYEYKILERINKTNLKHVEVPKVFAFMPLRNALFIEYIRGRSMLDVINKERRVPNHFIERIIRGLIELQHVKFPPPPFLDPLPHLRWIHRDIHMAGKKLGRSQHAKLLGAWQTWQKRWRREFMPRRRNFKFAHGDMNAKNIYIRDHKITLIDFDRVHLAPTNWDLASFISQIETFSDMKLSLKARMDLKNKAFGLWIKMCRPDSLEISNIAFFENYFRIAAIANIATWGNPYNSKLLINRLLKHL